MRMVGWDDKSPSSAKRANDQNIDQCCWLFKEQSQDNKNNKKGELGFC